MAQKLEFTEIQFLKTNFKSQVDGDLTIDDHTDFDQELYTSQSTISGEVVIILLKKAQTKKMFMMLV